MSNFFKQYNTVNPGADVRVIDYNAMVEQKLAELNIRQSGQNEPGADEFQGLAAIAGEVIKENPEEVLEKAKAEAEEILKSAREESEALLASAREQSEVLLEQAREKGHEEGYQAGFAQAKEELESEYERRNGELEQSRIELQESYQQEMKGLEPKLLDVILRVVEKVFHIQFDDKKEILLHLVSNTIENIEGCRSFRIRVGDEQKVFLEHHKEEILERIGHDMSLEILSDVSLEGNQCIIETDTGIFDCSLGVQLENLIKDLKSLSS